MAFIEWSDSISVGVNQFDDDHRKLFAIANKLHESIKLGFQQNALVPILEELLNYTIYHFGREEQNMVKHSYPDYENHRKAHQAIIGKVQDFYDQANSGKTSISLSLLGFFKEWLMTHIMGIDAKYKPFFKDKDIA